MISIVVPSCGARIHFGSLLHWTMDTAMQAATVGYVHRNCINTRAMLTACIEGTRLTPCKLTPILVCTGKPGNETTTQLQ